MRLVSHDVPEPNLASLLPVASRDRSRAM